MSVYLDVAATHVSSIYALQGAVWSCVMNEPALLAATGSADFTARLWNACDGNQLYEFQHAHIVKSVRFSYDSSKLATGGKGWTPAACL
jgi:serine-threonine kinase receptor-associated protein